MMAYFLEYSWNIPYSKKNKILIVMEFFRNIPFYVFSYSMEYSVEYSIFQELKAKSCDAGA